MQVRQSQGVTSCLQCCSLVYTDGSTSEVITGRQGNLTVSLALCLNVKANCVYMSFIRKYTYIEN